MKTFLFLLTGIFLVAGCTRQPVANKDLYVLDLPALMGKKGVVRISDFCDSVDFVLIRSNSEWYFPQYVLQQKCFRDYILFRNHVRGKNIIGVYRRTGDFVLRLDKRGKGPGEYTVIQDFGMDPSERRIWVLERSNASIHWYDTQGKWMETIRLPSVVSKARIIENGEMLLQNLRWSGIWEGHDDTRLFLTDSQGRFIRPVWIRPKDPGFPENSSEKGWLFQSEGRFYYHDYPGADTLYRLNDRLEPEPFIVSDPGKLRIPDGAAPNPTGVEQGKRHLSVGGYLFSCDYLMLSAASDSWNYFRINRSTGEAICSDRLEDDLVGLKGVGLDRTEDSRYLVHTINLPYFRDHPDLLFQPETPAFPGIQEQIRKIIDGAGEDDELILVYYRIKEARK